MTDTEALKFLEDLIENWTTVDDRLPKDINAHSMLIGEKQMNGLKICAARLQEKAGDQERRNERAAGWQTHPGTHCGHFFPAGEEVSLCRRERRTYGGETLDDCARKCAVCEERSRQPRTGNLFA